MTIERNTIYLGDFMDSGLPDHCCDLIIADPPYYLVKGDFDFLWETFDDYLKSVERWAAELARLMSYNGTLVCLYALIMGGAALLSWAISKEENNGDNPY